jgi:glycosyltransferase involved in cell wall biosynthesis
MILLSHPTGNANVRHAALGLQRADLLGEFWTCLNFNETPILRKILPRSVSGKLGRRSFPKELSPRMRSFPFREIVRLLAPRAGLSSLVRHETGPFSIDAVYHSLDRKISARLASGRFQGVYAYEDGAEESFRVAGRHGFLRLYDLPIGYWRAARKILAEEAEREPEWASTLTALHDGPEKTERKDSELRQADLVFVASSFTLKTLDEAPDFKGTVAVIPYGAPVLDHAADVHPGSKPKSDKLRVLFAGGLGQRKGLSYLFEACRRLKGAATLTVIGARPPRACAALDRELAGVRWIPTCSHAEVLSEMAAHDVFVFPSLFEGFGLVLLEAMAMGLPIITTPNTAAPDLIDDGVEGFIVPIRSPDAIVEKLELLIRDPDRRTEMSLRARSRALEHTWERYEETLVAGITSALTNQ